MMSADTEQLEREVEARRSNVESTIDELRSRLSVGQIVDEFSGYMKDGQASALAQNFGRQVRDNPLALGLIGAGVAWLLLGDGVRGNASRLADRAGDWRDQRHGDEDAFAPYPDYRGADYGGAAADRGGSGYPGAYAGDFAGDGRGQARYPETARYDLAGDEDYAGYYGSPGAERDEGPGLLDRARSAAASVADRISGGASAASAGLSSARSGVASVASGLGSGAGRYGRSAADAASYAGRRVGRGAHGARRTFVETLQEEPLIVGAIAVAIGAAIGASLPSTRIEDEYLGEARDRLREKALATGRDAVESAKHVAQETYRAASEEADRQGLKPGTEGETLADKLSVVVTAAGETAKSEAKREGLI